MSGAAAGSKLRRQVRPWLPRVRELLLVAAGGGASRGLSSLLGGLKPEQYPGLWLSVWTDAVDLPQETLSDLGRWPLRRVFVAIDAATGPTYRLLHQADLSSTRRALDRLAELRLVSGFSLYLTFTLGKGNLHEAAGFLDMCDRYSALPLYTLDEESYRSAAGSDLALRGYHQALDRLDKELWARGYDQSFSAGVAGGIGAASRPRDYRPLGLPRIIYAGAAEGDLIQVARGVRRARRLSQMPLLALTGVPPSSTFLNSLFGAVSASGGDVMITGGQAETSGLNARRELRVDVPDGADEESVRRRCSEVSAASEAPAAGECGVLLVAGESLREHWEAALGTLRRGRFSSYSLQIPYWLGGRATSALEWVDFVKAVKSAASRSGWRMSGGRPDPCALGLAPAEQYPEAEIIFQKRRRRACPLSIVSAAYNRAAELPAFIQSVGRQKAPFPFELILVDDGSGDQSLEVATRLCRELSPRVDITLLSLRRSLPYRHGTFTFRAGAARQCGVEVARGERILFLDPDEELGEDCVAQHDHWGNLGFDVVIGTRLDRPLGLDGIWSRQRQRLRHRQPLFSHTHWWRRFFTGNASVRRAALDAAGGFDESLQYWGLDDTDLGYRLARVGASAWHTQRAEVTHLHECGSGGGRLPQERLRGSWIHMEVMFRKYLDEAILDAFKPLWSGRRPAADAAGAAPPPKV
jgi:glycosyltransferase involved in cell wall biosynthesis